MPLHRDKPVDLEATLIPKIIWQTHECDYVDLPDNFKKATMTWVNLNPTWDYKYVNAIDRAEQVKSFDENLYLFYEFMDEVTKADVWRYIIVYINGGFYADMDSVCSTPLDFVVSQMPHNAEVVATEVDHNGMVNNANFGAMKNSNCMSEVIAELVNKCQQTTLASILVSTKRGLSLRDSIKYELAAGPTLYSSVLMLHKAEAWTGYTGALHTSDIKDPDWDPDYEVDYYGEPKQYLDLVRDSGWNLI